MENMLTEAPATKDEAPHIPAEPKTEKPMNEQPKAAEDEITMEEKVIRETINNTYSDASGVLFYFVISFLALSFITALYNSSWTAFAALGIPFGVIYYLVRIYAKNTKLFHQTSILVVSLLSIVLQIQLPQQEEVQFINFFVLLMMIFYQNRNFYIIPLLTFLAYYNTTVSFDFMTDFGLKREHTFLEIFLNNFMLVAFAMMSAGFAERNRVRRHNSAIQNFKLEKQVENTDQNIRFAKEIASGNLEAPYTLMEGDTLGASLVEMQQSLKTARDEDRKRSWTTEGIAKIEELLRLYNKDLDELSYKIISYLVSYLHSNQGSMFVVNDDDEDDISLELRAAFAFNRKKYLEKTIRPGQGLAGQVYFEKQTIHLKEIPEDYINITSGLGDATPSSLLIIPLKLEDRVVGVIELASFSNYKDYEIEFLEKVGESIASTLISSKNNQRTAKLLQESREMTEQMRSQEEEMRQNMEEMEATQEEMTRAKLELEDKESNLNALINNTEDSIITIDRNYSVKVVNQVVKNRYKGTQYEGLDVGTNALDILGDVKNEWKGYYDRAFAGEKLNFTIKSSVKGENQWREYFINPMENIHGEIIGASVFSRDVTERMKAQKENEELLAKLNQSEKIYDDFTYRIEIDANGNIIKVNSSAASNLGYTENEILGQHASLLFEDETALQAGMESMKNGKLWKNPVYLKRKDGSNLNLSSVSSAIFDSNHSVKAYLLVLYD